MGLGCGLGPGWRVRVRVGVRVRGGVRVRVRVGVGVGATSCIARMSEIDSVRCGLARFWLPDMTSTLFTWEGMGSG